MSKSILVMDTPELCFECPLCAETVDEYIPYCCGNGNEVTDYLRNKSKPGWCPLKEVPERKDVSAYRNKGVLGLNTWVQANYDAGYNACIDEILEGSDGE